MAAYCSPFAILVHSHLGLEWGATAAGRFYHEEDDEGGGERQRHFNPRQANIIVCDEDPTVSLVEEVKLCRGERVGGPPFGGKGTDPPIPGAVVNKEGGRGLVEEEPAKPLYIYN